MNKEFVERLLKKELEHHYKEWHLKEAWRVIEKSDNPEQTLFSYLKKTKRGILNGNQ